MDVAAVFIVDGDARLRHDLQRMLESEGYQVKAYASGDPGLRLALPARAACALVDADSFGHVPDIDPQVHLGKLTQPLPVVVMAHEPSVSMVVQAMKRGAVDVIVKPPGRHAVLAAVEQAIATSASHWQRHCLEASHLARLRRLSKREHTVFTLVARGLPNKKIAAQLGIAEKTVKVHRSRVMHKLEVGSLADLVRLAARLDHLAEPFASFDHPTTTA